jgi:hypothetical protein
MKHIGAATNLYNKQTDREDHQFPPVASRSVVFWQDRIVILLAQQEPFWPISKPTEASYSLAKLQSHAFARFTAFGKVESMLSKPR